MNLKVAGEKLELLRQYCPRMKTACVAAPKEVVPKAGLSTSLDGIIKKMEKLPQYMWHPRQAPLTRWGNAISVRQPRISGRTTQQCNIVEIITQSGICCSKRVYKAIRA
jgi:hypothetical protein